MAFIVNKLFNEINLGDTASVSRLLTENDVTLFALVSGDVNPAHLDPEYAKNNIFHRVIGHGMWTGALISAVLGTTLPGPGTIYLNQTLQFLRPVGVGDTITASVTVIKKYILQEVNSQQPSPAKHVIELNCQCVNQANKAVVSGVATVLAPTERVEREQVILPEIIFKQVK